MAMALSNRERIDRGFQELAGGLRPFVDRIMSAHVPGGQKWWQWYAAQEKAAGRNAGKVNPDDPAVLLNAIVSNQKPFMERLSMVERNYAAELKDFRNKHAHHEEISGDDVTRALDTMERLLTAVGSVAEATSIRQLREDHQRGAYESRARKKAARTDVVAVAGSGLKSWRDIVAPHDDVAGGQFNAAEFAADLHAVATGEGETEYGDAVAFFERTYLTTGLRELLTKACDRIGGDSNASPVVNLQTNFGGGKTHSMLALYHAFSGTPLDRYPQEVQDLLGPHADTLARAVPRVALVGHRNIQVSGTTKPDGTVVRTIWGELAWQLGGREAFEIVRADDELSTAPTTSLTKLIRAYAPCLILVDEWVAYARQLVSDSKTPAGTFETQFTFAQSLAQTTADTRGALLVVSIPASDNPEGSSPGVDEEVGGPDGRAALERLQNVIRRSADQWRPASSDESFEIVRRRLFKDPDARALEEIATIAKQYKQFYNSTAAKGHFPSSATDITYEDRIRRCYPIHPELFDRLYGDWSTLEHFQRTRGVLRLMSKVVHTLWLTADAAPLINVGSIPLEDDLIVSELTQYLEDAWKPIIEADIDGANATSRQIDAERTTFGQRSTARRLARATFFGSAPTLRTAHKGIDRPSIYLGIAVPGDTAGNFGSALDLLQQRSSYLEVDGARYWYDTARSVGRIVRDHAESLRDDPGSVHAELVQRIRTTESGSGPFAGIHICPEGSAEITDDDRVRLVVIHPAHGYAKGDSSPALKFAKDALDRRGSAQRSYRSMLVFLAPDANLIGDLEDATRQALAWRYLEERSEEENLTAQQTAQVRRQRERADEVVHARIRETYVWALAPSQTDGATPDVEWERIKADGEGALAERAGRKLANEGCFTAEYAARNVRDELDGPLQAVWKDGSLPVERLWDFFAKYLYLTRLRDRKVLEDAIIRGQGEGFWEDHAFALAKSFDSATGRFEGLVLPSDGDFGPLTDTTLVVSPAAALAQREQEPNKPIPTPSGGNVKPGPTDVTDPEATAAVSRFYGSIVLDSAMPAKSFNKVLEEVIRHLRADGTKVVLTLDIQATNDDGLTPEQQRIVSENAAALKFNQSGFGS